MSRSRDFRYAPMSGEIDLPAIARLIHFSFASATDQAETWLRSAGLEHVRVIRDTHGTILGSLLRIPMGQFFGGRSVRMLGIAGVAVAPEARGTGVARELMRQAMIEAHAEGWPLAGLYASTQSLYRQVGFEQAGHRFRIHLRPDRIGVFERGFEVRALSPSDEPAVESCYREFASRFNGPLDRGPYVWSRVRERRGEKFDGFGVFDAGRLLAYVYLAQRRKPDSGRHDLAVSDAAHTTAASGRRLLTLLADFGTMGDEIELFGGPLHPLLTLMPLQQYHVQRHEYWMTRVLNVESALAARGCAPGATADWAFSIRDELIASNAGSWTVRAERGELNASRAEPSAALSSMDVRGLAAIYTGLWTPREAATAGLVEGPDEYLAQGAALFGGGSPWMSDMF